MGLSHCAYLRTCQALISAGKSNLPEGPGFHIIAWKIFTDSKCDKLIYILQAKFPNLAVTVFSVPVFGFSKRPLRKVFKQCNFRQLIWFLNVGVWVSFRPCWREYSEEKSKAPLSVFCSISLMYWNKFLSTEQIRNAIFRLDTPFQ